MQTKFIKFNFSRNILLLIFLLFSLSKAQSQSFHDITEDVSGFPAYKKAEFSLDSSNLYYFKYTISDIPKSRVMAFRFVFDEFDVSFKDSKIVCTSIADTAADNELKTALDTLDITKSTCVGDFNEQDDQGMYDGIMKLDNTKKKIGIKVQLEAVINFKARIFLRIAEEDLSVEEQTKNLDQSHSLVPNTVVIKSFRDYASKILFYSLTRELQMYYVEGDATYPEKLFSGNVLLVYTNPNQVRQKYKNANTMVLLSRPFSKSEPVSEQFQFQVKFFDSEYLLDYFLSNNPDGRSKNTPLMINMTVCTNPYYVVLNYNKKESKTSLYIDQVYGKINKLSVATSFGQSINWDDMIEKMEEIRHGDRYYGLPANMESHIDVYKVECQVPLLLNFYYVDEKATIPPLDYGHVAIIGLKASKTYTLPFASGVYAPILTIEVFNPIKLPFVIWDDGRGENIISTNSLTKITPMGSNNTLVIKERNGDSGTRVIIKVGYAITGSEWVKQIGNIYYNENLNLFVFSFPNDLKRFNYTYGDIITRGKNEGDNIKYCFAPSIGAPILPSAENCFRVSLDNSYTLKVLNPLIMYKDYEFAEDVGYYVSIKPIEKKDDMEVLDFMHTYDTEKRNIEGQSTVLEIGDTGSAKTILTAPLGKETKEFIQVTQCAKKDIRVKAVDAFAQNQYVLNETEIPSGTKNFWKIVDNVLLEAELVAYGESGTKVFVRHTGIRDGYYPDIIDDPLIEFNDTTNEIILHHPINNYERTEYTVYVAKEGELSGKDITLCSIAQGEKIASYSKSIISYGETVSIPINFEKVGLTAGQKFEAIVYYEQKLETKMAFLSEVYSNTVGEIKIDAITKITRESQDGTIVYAPGQATSDGKSLYFSYMPTEIRDVPVGAFRIEFDNEYTKSLSGVYCAFVDKDETASGMIEAVEDTISVGNPFCIGGKSVTDKKNYNYLFRYKYTDDNQPKKLVIKITNNQNIDDGFSLYLRKGENTYINSSDFESQVEYGKREQYEKTMMPYILDLDLIRGNNTEDYISKVLIYSRYLEMQMFYLDETGETNMPILLFTGNIMLVYTRGDLAIQKYHSKKLILLSENLNGQEHDALGNNFRFHTKMFKSADQVAFFMSNNPTGRTLNYPLSLEVNSCSSKNNKYYYILNYNREEDERILYLDLVYGIMQNARVAQQSTSFYWNDLINNDMTEIKNMQVTLGANSQHIDVVEIECKTPLLINAYYNTPDEQYLDLNKGEVAVKIVPAKQSISFSLDPYLSGSVYTTVALYNPYGDADVTINYGTTLSDRMIGNSVKVNILLSNPKSISAINNGNTDTRVIVKIGFGVESAWEKEQTPDLTGEVFSYRNQYVYKFPYNSFKSNYTDVEVLIKPKKKDTDPLSPNIKFCYSTSIGTAIDVSPDTCFRTGVLIPYTIKFLNPLIAPKNYNSIIDYYYLTFAPQDSSKYISLEIKENKYEIEKRNLEGGHSVLILGEEEKKNGIILSIPSESYCSKIFVQLQVCSSEYDNITYTNLNAFSKEEISKGIIKQSSKLFSYTLDNNKMETEIDFLGYKNDKIFVKHMGITDTSLNIDEYKATWVENKNSVSIIKPIKNNEAFSITVLVAEKGHFNSYSLCTFAETPSDKYSALGDYVATFTSVTSDIATHFIDFSNVKGYDLGKEFDLLVYAVQINKMKVEVLYKVISGKVGKIEGIDEINGEFPDKTDYVTHLFTKNATSNNYLYYNFKKEPEGDIASLKIFANSEAGMTVSKVCCTFVKPEASPEEMIYAVNEAERTFNNLCAGETFKDSNGFDALINAKDYQNGNTKLVILVKYGMGESQNENDEIINDDVIMNITLRTTGYKVTKDGEFNEEEELTLVPYVFDLKEIREMEKENYHSKVLIYSSTREMDMYYLQNGAPVELFSGNIMMVYTNEDVIKEKYNGASTMILITDSLSHKKAKPFGEKFKFQVSFFNSKKSIQYYVSANPIGRPLNNPTTIEMLSCEQPYYYILNYHFTEGDRMLHIDTIFGEIKTTKFADQLLAKDWDSFVEEMTEFQGDELSIEKQNKYHIDVFEVTCNTPLLLNIYYTDETNPHKSNLQQGDVSILSLHPNTKESLSFIENLSGERFLYSFNVQRTHGVPNILIQFENKETMTIKQNGIYIQNTTENYRLITVSNKQLTGDDTTKVIFKFGYNIEETFTKIQNDMYNLQTKDRKDNIFAYIFKKGEDRLNYTKVDFEVKTSSENVKFCYSTNLGAFINPSTQNCFRVGLQNSYTISVMNPYIMYKNYFTGDEVMDYFVSFKTEKKDLNITIVPKLYKYDTENRNMPEIPNKIVINNSEKTILTNPENNLYLFVQMDVCTPNSAVRYEFKNAFSGESLGEKGEIQSGAKYKYKSILNTKLDTELVFDTKNTDVEMFIKHTGIKKKFEPNVKKISIKYQNNKLNFTQPIAGEEFNYTILIDKRGSIKELGYTLCNFTKGGSKAYYTAYVTSSAEEVSYEIDFSGDLEDYKDFEVLILAQETNNGKMMILSDIYSPNDNSDGSGTRTALIIIIIVLVLVCITGGIAIFLYLRKLKSRPVGAVASKPTDIADIDSAEAGQKLVESMSQSVVAEHQ